MSSYPPSLCENAHAVRKNQAGASKPDHSSVALAITGKLPLMTANRDLAKAAKGHKSAVILIS
jgi:hypothetical protein